MFVATVVVLRLCKRLLLALLRESLPGDSEDSLEALAALSGVLAEALDSDFLDAVLDLLPATAHGNDLGRLVEVGLARAAGGSVSDSLLHREKLTPGHVLRAHCDGLFARVDVGDFVDETGVV